MRNCRNSCTEREAGWACDLMLAHLSIDPWPHVWQRRISTRVRQTALCSFVMITQLQPR